MKPMTLNGYTKLQDGVYHLLEYTPDNRVPDHKDIEMTYVFTDRDKFIKFLTRDFAPDEMKKQAEYKVHYILEENPQLPQEDPWFTNKSWTYDELLEVAKTVTRVGITPMVYYTTQHITPWICYIPPELISKTYRIGNVPVLNNHLYGKGV